MTVNISARQFSDGTLSDHVRDTLSEFDLSPDLLELEITEGVMMHNPEKAAVSLKNISGQGISIAVDDFGTGYSSLSYLRRFPIKSLKIDKSFVRDVTTDSGDASIVKAIIAMAHSMGLRVVAEGVETSEQLDFLAEHECDIAQGFLFCHPLSVQHMTDYLSHHFLGNPSS